ncbi:MAG TPA: acyltransferase [Micromonosporaceae bacterium]
MSSQHGGTHTPPASEPTGTSAAGQPDARSAPRSSSSRDRWFDLLRAVALARVIVYHMFGAAWVSYLFPAIGVMFALAGSLMVRSLDRSTKRAVTGRIRRLLPALWVQAAILVPLMLALGWPDRPPWPRLLTWVVPVATPPGTAWAEPATEVLWYLVTYLWLVLLSPALLWLFRRLPAVAILLPLAVLVVLSAGLFQPSPTVDDVATDVATFGACWAVGFAHRDGVLRRVPWAVLIPIAVVSVAAGAAWALTHPDNGSIDLNDVPVGQAFYSLGIVLVLMRAAPPMGWLPRVRPLDRLVTTFNARAVTIYLWHNLAIAAAFAVGDLIGVFALGNAGYFAVALVLLAAIVLLIGWVEDLAARRSPRLLPWRGLTPRRREPAAVTPEPAAQP